MSEDMSTPSRHGSASSSGSGRSTRPPELRVELGRRADGSVVLRCTRADGSVTWQKQELPNARFFPLHDLAHYAVETVLGFRRGFFGLIADGWDITDTGGKGPRGPLPRESVLVEHIVGLLDHERRGATPRLSAAELLEQLRERAVASDFPLPGSLDDARLDAVRARIAELHARWRGTEAGGVLGLEFGR